MCMNILLTYVPVYYLCEVSTDARRGHLIPPELKLQTVVSHQVGAGIRTLILWKSSQHFQPLDPLSSPNLSF